VRAQNKVVHSSKKRSVLHNPSKKSFHMNSSIQHQDSNMQLNGTSSIEFNKSIPDNMMGSQLTHRSVISEAGLKTQRASYGEKKIVGSLLSSIKH
jgi:hypothetical protein